MTRSELRAGASLSAIFGLRMLGLFLILPVFAVHAPQYAGGSNLVLVAAVVPDLPDAASSHARATPGVAGLAEALGPELLRLNFGIFVLHMVQMAMFVVVPTLLVGAGLSLADHWMVYLPVVLVSFAVMVPPILYADRRNQPKPVLIGSVALLLAVMAALALSGRGVTAMAVLLFAFFSAFNILEAILPSLVTRIAPVHARGTAIGVYNTAQTLGLFFGGLGGGWIAGRYGPAAVFGACAVLTAFWLAACAGMRAPRRVGAVNPA